jgi:hypothetical protein
MLERIKKEAVTTLFKYYPGIRLEGLRKTSVNIAENNQSPGWDLKPGPPEYEVVLTSRL